MKRGELWLQRLWQLMLLCTQQCSSNHGVRFKLATKGVTKRKGQMLANFSEMEANPRFMLRSYGVVLFNCTALRPLAACTSLGFPVLVLLYQFWAYWSWQCCAGAMYWYLLILHWLQVRCIRDIFPNLSKLVSSLLFRLLLLTAFISKVDRTP